MGKAGVQRAEDPRRGAGSPGGTVGSPAGGLGGRAPPGLAHGAALPWAGSRGCGHLGRLTWLRSPRPRSPGCAHLGRLTGPRSPRLAAAHPLCPALSTFLRAGGAPCRPQRVALRNAFSPARGRPGSA